MAYAEYNDEPPPDSTVSSTYAHSKGVLMSDAEQGYWLVHSKPHWPNAVEDGAGPLPDFTYAQSFLCVTFPKDEIEKIATLQQVNYPAVYDSYVSDSSEFPEFAAWVAKTKSSLTSSTQTLTSSGGIDFTQFAKSKAWDKDLYEDLVAPSLKDGLKVETWRDGSGGRLPSFCTVSNGSDSAHAVDYDVLAVNLVRPSPSPSPSRLPSVALTLTPTPPRAHPHRRPRPHPHPRPRPGDHARWYRVEGHFRPL